MLRVLSRAAAGRCGTQKSPGICARKQEQGCGCRKRKQRQEHALSCAKAEHDEKCERPERGEPAQTAAKKRRKQHAAKRAEAGAAERLRAPGADGEQDRQKRKGFRGEGVERQRADIATHNVARIFREHKQMAQLGLPIRCSKGAEHGAAAEHAGHQAEHEGRNGDAPLCRSQAAIDDGADDEGAHKALSPRTEVFAQKIIKRCHRASPPGSPAHRSRRC